jgi:formylglycine-generating enzyme required for sulfatase activity
MNGCFFEVLRGGSWLTTETYLRASFRDFYHPANRFYHIGFRLALPAK